jgi:threonyl-tRNA synthetase
MSDNNEQLQNKRHSLAHLLAAAVMQLWPDTKRTIGPAIDDGFYFDFEFSQPITEKDLPKIEKQMRKILPTWDKFERHELDAAAAKQEYPGNSYKHELIDEFTKDGEKVSFYKSGDYWDLCRGESDIFFQLFQFFGQCLDLSIEIDRQVNFAFDL